MRRNLLADCHHVDTVWLALRAFLVHELVDRLIHWSALQEDAHHQEKCPAQGGRSPLGNAAAADIYLAGLVRGVNTCKGHQRFLGMKTAHIANFSYELGAEVWGQHQTSPSLQDIPAEKLPETASPV